MKATLHTSDTDQALSNFLCAQQCLTLSAVTVWHIAPSTEFTSKFSIRTLSCGSLSRHRYRRGSYRLLNLQDESYRVNVGNSHLRFLIGQRGWFLVARTTGSIWNSTRCLKIAEKVINWEHDSILVSVECWNLGRHRTVFVVVKYYPILTYLPSLLYLYI